MEEEIRAQPAILRNNASLYLDAAREALAGERFELIVLVARGSSDHAALYARYLFEIALGIPCTLAAPSVLTQFSRKLRYPRCLGIGISQSGAAPDVAEVILALREDGHRTLGLTNTPGSRLTRAAEIVLCLEAGAERSVAATKTYSASLLALYQIARALGDGLPEPALPDDVWSETARQAAERAVSQTIAAHPLFALGRGYDFCTAHETALKLMECALIACKSYSAADFQHGPKALAGPGSAALLFHQDGGELAAQGCAGFPCPAPPPEVPVEMRPLWDILFGQWLALLSARAKGLDPDDPRHLSKITETR